MHISGTHISITHAPLLCAIERGYLKSIKTLKEAAFKNREKQPDLFKKLGDFTTWLLLLLTLIFLTQTSPWPLFSSKFGLLPLIKHTVCTGPT